MKIGASKVSGQRESQFWDSHSGVLRKKCHLDVTPMESRILYYREGSGASSKVASYVKLEFDIVLSKSTTPLVPNLHKLPFVWLCRLNSY